jgi:hypothetical protein
MPIKGVKQAKQKTKQWSDKVIKKAESTVTQVLIAGLDASQEYMPRDTGFLINSSYRTQPEFNGVQVTGSVGNTQGYALPLHSPESKMLNWKPRPIGTKVYGKKDEPPRVKTATNMEAKQGWFTLGFADAQQTIDAIVKKGMSF